jgi:radical SAM protein with 4Fe4S-binding SPASM domain
MNDLLYLQVETTNHCNAKCLFCPQGQFKEKGFMAQELYEKIVEEASRLPNLTTFHPMLTGEPFMDKHFMERLKLSRAKLPDAEIEIYTNGSFLNADLVHQLAAIPKLRLSVSLNGLSPETREKVMGLKDYWTVVQAFKLMDRLGLRYRATMVAYPEISQDEVKAFIESGGTAIRYQSWAGIQYPYERKRWTSCPRAINQMTVLYTGVVCLCCFDPFGDINFGNLNDQTIEEVWKTSRHQEYQSMHKQGRGHELEKCSACTES